MSDRGHRQIDHTADLAFELWAPTEVDLLIEGARALVENMTDGKSGTERAAGVERRTVKIDALDPEDRLVQWLNEVVYLATTRAFLFADADLRLTESGLEAEIEGEPDARRKLVSELKSVTYHDLVLNRSDDGFRAVVVIDV